ncbi:DUF721 domain-containing protein [Roseimaritima sediminicola]|uniref:DUF721 domain-containing protein n=1 Tax=Roseimaritima sediminicola TaxID=2662066 RepID=UPI00129844DA|nr:DUF721 domain-containing protein [Roseimaritima sediminicola]
MDRSSNDPYDDRKRRMYPRRMGSIVNQLIARRGYAQVSANEQLQGVVGSAVGKDLAAAVRVGNLKRGVLELYASDSVTMQELTFLKRKILRRIEKEMPGSGVKNLRFRISGSG